MLYLKSIIPVILLFCTVVNSRSYAQTPIVLIETSLGVIRAEIYLEQAPITAGNFLKLVDEGLYNNNKTMFYRAVRIDNQSNDVKIEVIQGGLSERDIASAIPHETTKQTGLSHLDGTLSMARSTPGTASSEFFICIGDQPALDFGGKRNPDRAGFAAFGRVTEGMDVVKKIQQQKDENQYLTEPIPIISIHRFP